MLKRLTKMVSMVMAKPTLAAIIKVFLILYASVIAPSLPPKVLRLLNNHAVKLVMIALIAFVALHDMGMALLLALGLMVMMHGLIKLENVRTIAGAINAPIDAVQEVANDVIDGAQELVHDAVDMLPLPAPVGSVVHGVNSIADTAVDVVQDGMNMLVDGSQSVLSAFSSRSPMDQKVEKAIVHEVRAYERD